MGFPALWESLCEFKRRGLRVCTRLVSVSSHRICYTDESFHASISLSDWDEGLHVWQTCRSTESTRRCQNKCAPLQCSAIARRRALSKIWIVSAEERNARLREEDLDMIQRTPLVRTPCHCLFHHSIHAHPVAKNHKCAPTYDSLNASYHHLKCDQYLKWSLLCFGVLTTLWVVQNDNCSLNPLFDSCRLQPFHL